MSSQNYVHVDIAVNLAVLIFFPKSALIKKGNTKKLFFKSQQNVLHKTTLHNSCKAYRNYAEKNEELKYLISP